MRSLVGFHHGRMTVVVPWAIFVGVLIGCGSDGGSPLDDGNGGGDPTTSWELVWQDEFDGDKLDTTKWTPRPDGKRKGGWWSQKAISLDGKGNLVIKTFMDGDKPTDGCITTQGKFEHNFGYYVARVKFQSQPGHWSAFWITGPGVGKVGDGARDGCEIDIMEKPWLDNRVTQNLHWDGYGKHHQHKGTTVTIPGIMEG